MRDGKQHLFDRPENVNRLIRGLYIACGVLLVAGLFVPGHGEFPWESAPEFFAAYGLVSCIVLVLAAKHILRRIVSRDERYYD